MKYFIFAMFFILSGLTQAQGFFVPDGAYAPTTEKLKPLNENIENHLTNYNQRRYKVIDGRVIALPNIPDEQPQDEQISDTPLETETDQPTTIAEPLPVEDTITPVTKPHGLPLSIQKQREQETAYQELLKTYPTQKGVPSFQNRYAVYLQDLQEFQKTGKMPKNKAISDTLRKLSASRDMVIFDGTIQ